MATPPTIFNVVASHLGICPVGSEHITGLFPQYAYKFNPFTDSESR